MNRTTKPKSKSRKILLILSNQLHINFFKHSQRLSHSKILKKSL